MEFDRFSGRKDRPAATWTATFEGGEAAGAYLHQGLVFSRANGVGADATDAHDVMILRRADYQGGVASFANCALSVVTEVGERVAASEINVLLKAVNKGPVGTETLAACVHATKAPRSDDSETGHTAALLVHMVDMTQSAAQGGAVTAELGISAVGPDPNYTRGLLQLAPCGAPDDGGPCEIGAGIFFTSDGNTTLRKAISFGHPRGDEVAPLTIETGIDFTTATFTGPTLIQGRGQLMALDQPGSIRFGIAAEDEVVGLYRSGQESFGFDAESGRLRINSVPVLSAQQPAVPDTSGASLSTIEEEVNKLKSLLRAHGLMALD